MSHRTVTPHTNLPCAFRIFQTNRNPVVFYYKILHLSYEAAFLSYNLWRYVTMYNDHMIDLKVASSRYFYNHLFITPFYTIVTLALQ